MKSFDLITETGNYWHFHPIGTGLTYTYHKTAKQVIVCNAATGQIITCKDLYKEGGFILVSEFKDYVMDIYANIALDKRITLEPKYFDTQIQSGEATVGIDLNLLSN